MVFLPSPRGLASHVQRSVYIGLVCCCIDALLKLLVFIGVWGFDKRERDRTKTLMWKGEREWELPNCKILAKAPFIVVNNPMNTRMFSRMTTVRFFSLLFSLSRLPRLKSPVLSIFPISWWILTYHKEIHTWIILCTETTRLPAVHVYTRDENTTQFYNQVLLHWY